ncbi:MAG TPA: ABC transporter ATP-binding protein [Caldilineales bacterium]|nr:ABC transporter ATP-binding protein [Caldilineales bacterium]
MEAIVTQHLHRRFRKTVAVRDLSFRIEQGEVFGLIGPDGAGKTTTLRMLAGVLNPTSGRAAVLGVDVTKDPEALRQKIGYMPQHFSLYGDLSVLENLTFFAEIYRVPSRERKERIARLLHFAQLQAFADRPAGKLSGGMKKKLGLACALIHAPQLLLLDEPTNGVDPVSRREFWDILAELHLQGVTILITTPYMDEAERCNRVGLMFRGEIIQQGEPEALRRLAPGEMLVLYTTDLAQAEQVLPDFPDYLEHQVYGDRLHIFTPDAQAAKPRLEAFLKTRGIPMQSLYQDEPRLEEAFIHLIRHARLA